MEDDVAQRLRRAHRAQPVPQTLEMDVRGNIATYGQRGPLRNAVYALAGIALAAVATYQLYTVPPTIDDATQRHSVQTMSAIELLVGAGVAGKFGRDLYRQRREMNQS